MRKAIVIGLSEFDDTTFVKLKGAAADARNIFKLLVDPSIGAADEASSALLLSPTRQELREKLESFIKGCAPGDEFILFLAGHGVRQQSNLFFPCQDTQAHRLVTSAFGQRDLSLILRTNDQLRGIVIIDTCFAGTLPEVERDLKARGDAPAPDIEVGREALVWIWSAGATEQSVERETGSIFAKLLADCLLCGAEQTQNVPFLSPGTAVDWIKSRLENTGMSKVFWPGLREGKAVADMKLSKNPNFEEGFVPPKAVSRVEDELKELAAKFERRPADARAKLMQLARAAQDGQLPSDFNGTLFRMEPGSRLGMLLMFMGIMLPFYLLIIIGLEIDASVGMLIFLGLGLCLIVFSLLSSKGRAIWFNWRRHFLMVTKEGLCLSNATWADSEPLIATWSDVKQVSLASETIYGFQRLKSISVSIAPKHRSILIGMSEFGSLREIETALKTYSSAAGAVRDLPDDTTAAPAVDEPLASYEIERFGLVGCSQYSFLPPLSSPVIDVSRLDETLSTAALEVSPLLNPDISELESWIGSFFAESRGKVMLFYFSGHGTVLGDELLLCVKDSQERSALSSIPVGTLLDLAQENRVRHLVLVLDCCFAGAAGEYMEAAKNRLTALFDQESSSITIFAAATRDQEAFGMADQMSLFTDSWVESLKALQHSDGPLPLMGFQEEAAAALDKRDVGQRAWRFASDVSHQLTIGSRPRALVEKVAERQSLALVRIWKTQVKQQANPVQTTSVGNGYLFVGNAITRSPGTVFLLKVLFIGAYFLVVLLGLIAFISLSPVIPTGLINWVVLGGLGWLSLRVVPEIHRAVERSSKELLFLSPEGIHTGKRVIPAIDVADLRISEMDDPATGPNQVLEVFLYDRSSVVLAETRGKWSAPVAAICQVGQACLEASRKALRSEVSDGQRIAASKLQAS